MLQTKKTPNKERTSFNSLHSAVGFGLFLVKSFSSFSIISFHKHFALSPINIWFLCYILKLHCSAPALALSSALSWGWRHQAGLRAGLPTHAPTLSTGLGVKLSFNFSNTHLGSNLLTSATDALLTFLWLSDPSRTLLVSVVGLIWLVLD